MNKGLKQYTTQLTQEVANVTSSININKNDAIGLDCLARPLTKSIKLNMLNTTLLNILLNSATLSISSQCVTSRTKSLFPASETILSFNDVKSNGAYLKLPGSEIKFSQKQFKHMLYTNPDFYNQFVNVCFNALTNDILERESKKKTEEQYGSGMVSPYQAILQQLSNV